LQFFSDRPKALDEAKRVLRPGGRAAFAVWQGLERQTVFASLCAAEVRYLGSLGVTPEDAQAPFLLGEAKEISSLLAAAGFRDIDVKPAVIEANFASSNFVRDVEYAYTAFVPEFRDNPAAFDEFVENVSRDIEPALAGHRRGERVVFPMPLNIATAIA
jgi:SAM-dependent methyltransferase